MSSKSKIAHITLRMEPGGIEQLIVNFARNVDADQFEIKVYCLDGGGVLLNDIHAIGFESAVLNRQPGFDWRLIRSLARLLHRDGMDIVHSHNEGAHFYGALAARLARVKGVITTEHSRNYIEDRLVVRRMEKRVLSMITDRWICVSRELADISVHEDGLSPQKVTVLTNGIDIDRFIPPPDAEAVLAALREEIGLSPADKLVLMVARLHPIKNHDLLIRALETLKGVMDDVHLLFVGDGELKNDLMALADSLGVRERVHFLGYRPDAERFLWLSDIFVLCSRTEGMPLSLLEALAAKTPVLITEGANRAGLIADGVNGKVVAGDAAALAGGMREILQSPEVWRARSEEAFAVVQQRFSLKSMVRGYEAVYRKLLRKPTVR